jgi:hypothetical protein
VANGNGAARDNRRDALGLTLDDADIFALAVAMVFYSDLGVGKTTAVAQSFPKGLFVQSAPTILRPYASWWKLHSEKAAKEGKPFAFPPIEQLARKTIPTPDVLRANGTNTWAMLTAICEAFVATSKAGTNPYEALIFDEWTALAAQVYADIEADPRFSDKRKIWDRIAELKRFHTWVYSIPRMTGKHVVLVCHSSPPAYYDADDDKISVALRGTLKYRGGPKMPIGTLIQPVCAAADVVVQMVVEAEPGSAAPKRKFLTAVAPLWERKFRDFRAPPEAVVEDAGLRKLLAQSGYLTE